MSMIIQCLCDRFILKLGRQSSAWAVLVMGPCYVVILRAREAPQSRGSRRYCVLSRLMTIGDALNDAAARGGRKGEAWMPTSTCGTEFYLLPKPGEEHGELVGPELVSEMDTDQSGMRIVSYGQYVSLPRPSSACLPPLLSMNASR